MSESLHVEIRDARGTQNARQLRRARRIPAVLYGHGQETVSLSVPAEELAAAFRHGSRLFDLQGALNESAIIQSLQWDPFGHDVLHVDFMRVSADERLTVEVPVELRGVAPGTKEGGIITQLIHEVEIETVAASIPDKLHVNINSLHLDGSRTAGDIEDLPQGAKLLTDADAVIVECVAPVEMAEAEAAEGEAAEPEVIGGREEEEGEEG